MPHADWSQREAADAARRRHAESRRMARQLLAASRGVPVDERLRRSEVAAQIIFGKRA